MPIGWFIVPYKRDDASVGSPSRYPAINDFTAQIYGDGGQWAEVEILGNRCIVKVRATMAQLSALAALPSYRRLPKDRLDDSLADLPAAVKTAVKNEILDAGYSLAEINARFPGDLGDYTLRDVLQFMATRRLKPRYDSGLDEIVLDGAVQPCEFIEWIDEEVSE